MFDRNLIRQLSIRFSNPHKLLTVTFLDYKNSIHVHIKKQELTHLLPSMVAFRSYCQGKIRA